MSLFDLMTPEEKLKNLDKRLGYVEMFLGLLGLSLPIIAMLFFK